MGSEKQAWTEEPALLPCPFCGGAGRAFVIDAPDGFDNEGGLVVECSQCQACSPVVFNRRGEDPYAHMHRWNKRQDHFTGKRDPQAWVEAVERLLNIANGLAVAVDMSRAYERSDAVASAFDAWEHNYATFLAIQEPPDAIADNLISRAPRRAGRSTLHQKEKTDEPT